MITLLIDHHLEGQVVMMWRSIQAEGWLELIPLQFVFLAQVGLTHTSSDREVWNFAQQHGMLLLTANRNMRGEDSLERIIREGNTEFSLPVITISDVSQLTQRAYRESCVTRLIEIVLDLENLRGIGRLFIP
jgi:hypothetical protein